MSARQLLIGAAGIYLSYLTSSILSQKLYSSSYPSTKHPGQFDKFNYPCLIVWFSSLLCALFGYVKGMLNNEPANPISNKEQMILGLLFTLNMLTANYALLYISYLEQAIGRNCRYLMVVIVGAYFSRVKKGSSLKLSPKKILVAAVITAGVLGFTILSDKKHGKDSVDQSQQWKGYLMLVVSITADALFSDSQAYSKAMFKPSSNHLFTSTSFFSFAYVLLFSIAIGQAFDQLKFCYYHPSVIFDILAMSVLQVLGQISIYYVIVNFKQHIFPLISTTRKVFTVLLSILIFGHHLTFLQWLSVLLVFAGLAYQLQEQLNAKKNKPEAIPQSSNAKQLPVTGKTSQSKVEMIPQSKIGYKKA